MKIIQLILPLLSFVLMYYTLGSSGVETHEGISSSGDTNFIREGLHEYSSQDPGFLHSKSNNFQREPRTFWIPIGNFFKKWTKPAAVTAATTSGPTITPINPPTVADQTALFEHNSKRNLHGAPLLTYNDNLKSIALSCANMHASAGDVPSLPPNPDPTVDNCLLISTMAPGATESWFSQDAGANGFGTDAEIIQAAISNWYDDQTIDFNPDPIYDFSHKEKAQIIWRSTTSFACATSTSWFVPTAPPGVQPDAPRKYVSCIYSPAGNKPTDAATFKSNVRPPLVNGKVKCPAPIS